MKRRQFIKNIASTSGLVLSGISVKALSASPALSSLASANNNKILILVQLHGGNDALNTVVPVNQYDLYYAARENIAIRDQNNRGYINLDETLALEDQVGLHPDMYSAKQMYDTGRMAVVQNVGYPNMNLSHFRGRDIMFTGSGPDEYLSSGWMGRFLNVEYPGYPDSFPSEAMPDPVALEIGNTMSLAFHREEGIPIGFNIHSVEDFYKLITTVGIDPPSLSLDSHASDELRYLLEFEKNRTNTPKA
ncbi:MAG: DUF1501 domain-containing protein [Bacteroidales bacterium]|nr:DUF1501 domain-containing protein [Bacteroidales bacterium]